MKLKVISLFRDKDDHTTLYEPETILEVKDEARAQSLIDRGLCKEFKGKTAPMYTLGDEEGGQSDGGNGGKDENPDTDTAGQEQNPNPEDDE